MTSGRKPTGKELRSVHPAMRPSTVARIKAFATEEEVFDNTVIRILDIVESVTNHKKKGEKDGNKPE